MNKQIFPMAALLAIAALFGAVLYWNGNYIVYMLAYIFFFVLLLCGQVFLDASVLEKIVQVLVYALILAAQIVFAVLVIRPAAEGGPSFAPCRLLGVLVIFIPFLLKQLWKARSGP